MTTKQKLLVALAVAAALTAAGLGGHRLWRLQQLPKGAWAALRHPDEVTLFSIEPDERLFDASPDPLAPGPGGTVGFHGYEVAGQTVIAGGAERRRIGKIVEALVIDGSDPAICFNPRHGIRITSSGETYDFVICLECRVMMVFHNNKSSSISGIGTDDGALNALLTAAGVPLARN